jgi:hypothetical protein
MPTYEVDIRETWIQTYLVEAADPEEALSLAEKGNGDPIDDRLEYSDTPDTQMDEEYAVREVDVLP